MDISESALAMAEEEAVEDVEQFAGWLESVSHRSLFNDYFGPISTPALVRLALTKGASNEQVGEAMREVRKRYLAEFAEDIIESAAPKAF